MGHPAVLIVDPNAIVLHLRHKHICSNYPTLSLREKGRAPKINPSRRKVRHLPPDSGLCGGGKNALVYNQVSPLIPLEL
jgi:hypothetical protein